MSWGLSPAWSPEIPRNAWTDVTVTLVAGIVGPAAEVAGLVARPLPLGEMARVLAELGCDRGLHQHVPLRVQSVPIVGGVNVHVGTAMQSYIHTYIHALRTSCGAWQHRADSGWCSGCKSAWYDLSRFPVTTCCAPTRPFQLTSNSAGTSSAAVSHALYS